MIPAQLKQSDIDAAFLTGPGEDIVSKLLLQMGSLKGFVTMFGPYKAPKGLPGDEQQRWADYQRFDWSIPQLPAINIFEAQSEQKQSANAYLTGVVSIQVIWPPNFRRPDTRRVEAAFKGALENFFESRFVNDMLDELYWIQRPAKVYGLNKLGNELTWTPCADVILETQAAPVTLLDVNYRIDLRAWYRALTFQNRTKDDPFEQTLVDLAAIGLDNGTSVIQGTKNDGQEVDIEIPDQFTVSNP